MKQPQRLNQITLDSLSFKDRDVAYIRCEGHMNRSKKVDESDDGREPATVMKVTNLEDGQLYRLICPALMVSAFADEDFEYVGKCFEVRVSNEPRPGKRYKNVEIYEISDPGKDYIVDGVRDERDETREG